MSLEVLNNMLKEYNPFNAMTDDVRRHDFLLKNIKKTNVLSDFRDGKCNIPMVTAQQSNVRSGKLVAAGNGTKGEHGKAYVEGNDLTVLNGMIEFTEEEIRTYGSTKRAFIKLFPDKVSELMENMKELVSVRFLLDGSISSALADQTGATAVNGELKVSRVQMLHKNQRLDFSDGVTTIVGVIKKIDINSEIIVVEDEVAAAPMDFATGFTAATDVKIYIYDDANKTKITLKSMLDSATASLYHLNKADAGPIWQAQNIDCSGISFSSASRVEQFFKTVVEPIKRKGKVMVPEIALPWAAFNALALKANEDKRYTASDVEMVVGYDKITIKSAGGAVTLYGVYDLEDEGFVIDWKNLCFISPEMFTTNREKGANQWYHSRTEDGHSYILDIKFQGAIAPKKLSGFALLTNINA
ncbi:MAG: hypothetical protein N4A33_04805 [Bacteriovoracaceae bacterium]|jgi:hypothetical protein|nr:hypothetical protein [Bacteriovoracaceae bacterium]